MKALTIEELKVGEWVWVVDIESPKHGSGYWQIHGFAETHIHLNQGPSIWVAPKALYGKDWVAYKNKEMAEAKGEIIELPCLRDKPTIYYHNQPILRKELNYMTKDGTICSEGFSEDEFEEAERRLAELKSTIDKKE